MSLSTMVEEATVSMHQELCLGVIRLRDAHTPRQQKYTQTYKCV